MVRFLEWYNLMSKLQYAFRKSHSTETVMLRLVLNFSDVTEEVHVTLLALDLTKVIRDLEARVPQYADVIQLYRSCYSAIAFSSVSKLQNLWLKYTTGCLQIG